MASLFLGLYYNLSIWFKIVDKTYFGTMISVSAAVLTISLNFILIPMVGYTGSAITTLVVYFYMCLFAYLTGQKFYPVNYKIGRLAVYFALAILLLIMGWSISFNNEIMTQALKEIPILLFVAIAYIAEIKKLKLNRN
jgi:O-antigen/teichoic acid export membrane protein